MWLEPQSLFVISEDVYTLMLHGIDEILSDVEPEESFLNSPSFDPGSPLRSRRISLTFRISNKVLSSSLSKSLLSSLCAKE